MYENINQILPNKLHVHGPMYYKISVTCVYNGHVFYTLFYQHDNLIHLFHNWAVRVMNSRVSMFVYNTPSKRQQVNGFEHKLDRYYLHYKSDQLPMFHSSPVCCLIRFLLFSNTTDLNTTTSKLYNNLFTSYYYICISGMINKCHV